MKFLASLMIALTAVAGSLAQSSNSTNATTFATGLLDALRTNNLTSLADAVGNNSGSLLSALMGGNKTVLAPTNAAFSALGDDVDTDDLIATLAYHVLNGTYADNLLGTNNKTIAVSSLNMSEYVQLPRNRSQVVVLSKFEGNNTGYVQQATGNVSWVTTGAGVQYMNLLVQPISQVLTIPGKTSDVAQELGATSLTNLLDSADLEDALDASTVTVFAPSNAAIESVMSAIQMANATQQQAVLLNHVLNGTVVYSTAITNNLEATSASGNMLRFTTNSTGAYVSSGNITAKIIRSDYAASNGVVHVIDQVLVNTTTNTAAAGSAFSSATAAAATQTSNPGTGSNPSSGSGSGSGGNNSAGSLKVSGAAAALAAFVGSGVWLLA